MTNRQLNNAVGTIKFVQNIGKLSFGRSTKFYRENADGSKTLIGKVRCDTVQEELEFFLVACNELIIGFKTVQILVAQAFLQSAVEN